MFEFPINLKSEVDFAKDKVVTFKVRWGRENRPLWKNLERMNPVQAVKWVERFSPNESVAAATTLAQIIEKAFQIEVSPRARQLRLLYLEIQRLNWSFLVLSQIFSNMQDRLRFQQAFHLKEMTTNVQETFAGGRVLPQVISISGVEHDFSFGEVRKLCSSLDAIHSEIGYFFDDIFKDQALVNHWRHSFILNLKLYEHYK